MTQRQRREIRVNSLSAPISHYTNAVVWGDLMFISGCTATNKEKAIVGGDDVAQQARQVLTNVQTILATVGASLADVLKMTVYLTDMNDRERINPVRQELFGHSRPASTLVEVSALAIPGAKVEIDAVASIPTAQNNGS